MKKIVVVGSNNFPLTPGLGAQVVDVIRELPEDAVVLNRGRGEFDTFISTVCMAIDRRCFGYPSEGGPDNWVRDVEMAKDADSGICFISREDLEKKETGGTLHVCEKLLDQGKPVKMYTEDGGSLMWAAET